jgi:ferredoxin
VPGFSKAKYHALAPHPTEFSKSLVDILEIVKPELNIMDAVFGMEGKGPSFGQKRFMGAIMASVDAVALDAIASAAIGFKPFEIETTRIAHERRIGQGDLEQIETKGTSLNDIKQEWKHPIDIHRLSRYVPKLMLKLTRPFAKYLRIDPIIIQEACTKCLVCLKNCPAHTIHQKNGKILIDHSNCIMCFCCYELCPYKAIKLKKSWLVRLLGIGR